MKYIAIAVVALVAALAATSVATAHTLRAVCVNYQTVSIDVDGYTDGSHRVIKMYKESVAPETQVAQETVEFGTVSPVAKVIKTVEFYVTAPGNYVVVDTPFGVEQIVVVPCGEVPNPPVTAVVPSTTPITVVTPTKTVKKTTTKKRVITCKVWKSKHKSATPGAFRRAGFKPNCGKVPPLPNPPRRFNPPVTG